MRSSEDFIIPGTVRESVSVNFIVFVHENTESTVLFLGHAAAIIRILEVALESHGEGRELIGIDFVDSIGFPVISYFVEGSFDCSLPLIERPVVREESVIELVLLDDVPLGVGIKNRGWRW